MEAHSYDVERELQERHWWFRVRRDIVTETIAALDLPPPEQTRALDLGCGSGSHGPALAARARVIGLDVASAAFVAEQIAYRWRIRGSALELPLRDGAIDLILAADLLEHLDDDSVALAELFRILRPAGYALLLVPAFGWLWGSQDEVSHHRRRYTKPMLTHRVASAGFDIARTSYFNTLLLPPIFLARTAMRWARVKVQSENTLTPSWVDGILRRIFGLEVSMLRHFDLPIGVSLLCLARRP